MVANIIKNLLFPVFRQCAYWTSILFNAVGGWGVYVAAFLLVCIVGLFITPLRGSASSAFTVYTSSKIHKSNLKPKKVPKTKVEGGTLVR